MSDDEHSRVREDGGGAGGGDYIRDIHALTPPHPHPHPHPPAPRWAQLGEADWSSQSTAGGSDGGTVAENIASMSQEFSALVVAGSPMHGSGGSRVEREGNRSNLARIGEAAEETNRLAIVPDPGGSGQPVAEAEGRSGDRSSSSRGVAASAQEVKKEEVEAKIMAWQTAKLAKINNRFKREDAVIKGWEGARVHKATARMKRIERKLEEKRARAVEKMENEVANARRRSEERRASAEAERGGAAARILELANLMRALGRPPVKRSFF